MNRYFLWLVLLLLTLPGFAQSLNPDGYLLPEKPFRLIPEFDHIALDAKGQGSLFIGSRRYVFAAKLDKGGSYSFQSETIHGTKLSFKGKFLVLGELSKLQPQGSVLKGTLTVHRPEGRNEEPVSFTYTVGD